MSFGKMNSFIDIVVMRKTKDPEGFATTAYDVIASVRAYREGRHGSQTLRRSLRQLTYSDFVASPMWR